MRLPQQPRRKQIHARPIVHKFIPLLEVLEERLAPAVRVWDGDAGNNLWLTAANWDGDLLPLATDDIVINPQATATISLTGASVTAQSLACTNANLTISGNGQLTITGAFTLQGGRVLQVDGGTALFSVAGTTTVDGASLFAKNGGDLLLPGLAAYTHTVSTAIDLQADGAGSVVDLSGMTTLTGPATGSTLCRITAKNGGLVDLHNLTQVVDPPQGSLSARRFIFTATGAGSKLDLSALQTLTDLSNAVSGLSSGTSSLEALNGGEVWAPQLTSLNNVGLVMDSAASVLPIAQYVTLTNGFITVSGASNSRTFTNLANADGSSLTVSSAAQLTLPALTAFTHTNTAGLVAATTTFQASGAGSVLNLSSLATITGSSLSDSLVSVVATTGGLVDLHNLTAMIDPPDGSLSARRFAITADGVGSLVDVSNLTTLLDRSNAIIGTRSGTSTLEADNGGEVRAPLLTSLNNTGLTIDGATSLLPIAQYTTLTNGFITVSGTGNSRSFSNLTNADGSSLTASTGGQLNLPALTTFTHTNTAGLVAVATTFQASGAGSVLGLSALATITGSSLSDSLVSIIATTGGLVDLHNLTAMIDPPDGSLSARRFAVSADGAGSLVDVSNLTTLLDRSNAIIGLRSGTSTLEVDNGGEVRAPLLATLDNTGLTIDGAASLLPIAQVTKLTNGFITVSGAGNNRTFTALTNADGSNLTASAAGHLTLPALANYTHTSTAGIFTADVLIQANGAGSKLSLPALTTVTGSSQSFTGVALLATAGGVLDLQQLAAIIDPPQGSLGLRRFVVSATGTGSLIDLPQLTTLIDRSSAGSGGAIGTSNMEAVSGGEVRVPLLSTLDNTTLLVDGATSILPTSQFSSITNGTITVSGVGSSPNFSSLSNTNSSSLIAQNGGKLRLPALTAYTISNGNLEWKATGVGSVLDLATLRSLTVAGGGLNLTGTGLTLTSLAITGGILVSGQTITVSSNLLWTAGNLRGTGLTQLLANAMGTISGTADKRLGGELQNAGRLQYIGSNLRFGQTTSDVGRLVNLARGIMTFNGDGDLTIGATNANHLVLNQGTLVRMGVGSTRIDVAFQSTGTIELQQGMLDLPLGSSLVFDGEHFLRGPGGTTLRVAGNIAGTTANSGFFAPQGTTTLVGGSAGSPRTLEVMGRDLGSTAAGFLRNFAYGTLQLENAFVRLVDVADNAAGAGNEALYADALIVPTGSTLDLNGLKLYCRIAQINGTVTGGSVTVLPDGGPLEINQSALGTIAASGEMDEWTFFGRAGQGVAIVVDPGNVPAPVLQFAGVELRKPDGTVLASGNSASANAPVLLNLASLPTDGIYKVRIKAASTQPTRTGTYRVSLFEVTTDTFPLMLDFRQTGYLETPFSIDRWTFSAAANQQVNLHLLDAVATGLRYRLTGPGGWTGFTDLATDSGPVTLPTAGQYVLEAYTNGAGAGAYSFRLDGTPQTLLPLDMPFTGALSGNGDAHLFLVNVTDGNPLVLNLDTAADTNRTEMYVKLGSAPTRQTFDYRNSSSGADHEIQVPFAAPGTWYVLVYGDAVPVPGNFTISAHQLSVRLVEVTPERLAVTPTATLTLQGAGFLPGTMVELVAAGGTAYAAQSVGVDSFTQMTAVFNLTTVPVDTYDVRVTLPSAATATLPGAFQVTAAGQPKLETRLILPSALGRHALATLYVEYANTGTAAMLAPILTLQSADPDDSDRPLLTLDETTLVDGFWTSGLPDGFGHAVQIYASGATPGVLLPGERIQVPVYYAGLQQPWDFSDDRIEFEVRVHEAGDTTAIDWPSLSATLKPDWMAADAWQAVVANLQANVGPTWGDYVQMLSTNAAYLGRLGERVTDVSALYGFELQQAMGLTPVRTLASATDAAVSSPGLALALGRTFGNTITERYQVGPFGRGWSADWQLSLVQETDGTVIIRSSPDSQRRFQEDSRSPGTYFGQAGDAGQLRKVTGGAFELTESSGLLTRFRADGTLEFMQDTNGNRITAGFVSGRLTTLTHSSGASLTIGYNGAGRFSSLTDSNGRVTTYGYDPTNTYLLTATGPGGTTTYAYTPDTTGPQAFALASVTDPSGVARFFEYDARGRLSRTFLSGNAEQVLYTYDAAGKVTATDAGNVSASTFFDQRLLVVRSEDGTGAYVRYEYDADRHLSRETDALGRSRSYTWCGCGSLLTATDEYGHVTTFTKGGPNNQPIAFTDANGNVTQYGYDAAGNLTSTTYADGSIERVAYDAIGNPTQLINRRGQSITRTFNTAGQLTGETFPDGPPTTYTYDARGRLATATDGSGTTTFTYDAADRLTRVDYPNGRWLRYEYDPAGRRTNMEDHTGFVVNYSYDTAGRLKELRDATNALIVTYAYDAAGRLSREDKGNGTYSVYGYDTAGRVESITHHAPDGSINSFFQYGYDTVGRRISQDTIDGTWAYTYDLSGQLTRAVFDSVNPAITDQDLNYAYDAMGNRTRTILNGVITDYATNNLNQYVTAGAKSFQYDLDGNLIEENGPDGARTYTYDSRNRLTQVTTQQGTWTNEYDVVGIRRASVNNGERTEYLLDPFGLVNVVGEYDGLGLRVTSYIQGLGIESIIQNGTRSFFDFDAIGSTTGLTSVGSGYVDAYFYDPFGKILHETESQSNPYKFIGYFGLAGDNDQRIFMRARYYDVNIGRFQSADPIKFLSVDFNYYRYGGNAPLSYVDVTGLDSCEPNGCGSDKYWSKHWVPSSDHQGHDFTEACNKHDRCYATTNGTQDECDQQIRRDIIASGASQWWGDLFYNKLHDYGKDSFDDAQKKCKHPDPQKTNGPELPPGPQIPGPPVPVPTAQDPNEKLGATGFGSQTFIAADTLIPYRINFENLGPGSVPTPAQPATAPAQRVEIVDQLSANLDWSTLRFMEFGFGDTLVIVPQGQQHYAAIVPMTFNGLTFNVEVELSFDATTGLLRAVFQAIDPHTFLPPDVLTGFLPPEDGTGRGKGHLAFAVQPETGLPSGTALRNVASIRFDGQGAIATNQIDPQNPGAGTDPNKEALNTIDAGIPTSQVLPLSAISASTSFTVSWSGQDDPNGSGIAFFDVYVSVDNGAFTLWQAKTTDASAIYAGADGHTYAFYSVATDHVGQRQTVPTSGQATTQVFLPPSAIDDVFGVDPGHKLTVGSTTGVLTNDIKLAGRTLQAVLVDTVAKGTLTLKANGSFTYTPGPSFDGVDSFTYRLRDNTGRLSNLATVTLARQIAQFRVTTVSLNEVAATLTLWVDLRVTPTQITTVDYSVIGLTAAAGVDFQLVDGTLTFNPGQKSKAITLTIRPDVLDEFNETFQVQLRNPSQAVIGKRRAVTYTILDNDLPPTVSFRLGSSSRDEGSTPANLEVFLSTASAKPITVKYAVVTGASAGTAKGSGVDFSLVNGTLTFNPGETVKQLPVALTNDSLDEKNETVKVQLSAPSKATLGAKTLHTLTILDNDPTPTVSFATAQSNVNEAAGTINLTVTLSAASALTITVSFAITGGTAQKGNVDYGMVTLTPITFAAGQTSKTITLRITNDPRIEPDETAQITLTNPLNALLGPFASHLLTILDDD